MIDVEIKEIYNGFIVYLFDDEGPRRLDQTVHVDSFEEALTAAKDFFKEEKEAEKEG